MKKTSSATSKTQPFSEQLCDYMRAQLKADEAEEVCDFAREYFSRLQLEGWENYRLSDIYACTYGLWNFLQVHNPRHPKVRVFNPSLEQDGWLCEHTVVTVLHEDAPFLVDSIRIEINRRGIPITSLRSTIFTVTRDQHHHCRALLPQCPIEQDDKKSHCRNEALVYLEISLQSSERKLTELATAIRSVLADVRAVVSDYHPMRDHALALADGLHAVEKKNAVKHIDETEDFLRWLTENHFTFLGCATYKLTQRSGKPVLKELPEQRLGLLKLHGDTMEQALDERRNPGVLAFCESAATMCFSKSPVHSRVHRKVYPDYLLIKRYNKQGKAVGIDVFLGLYTLRVYNLNPAEIPYVSEKIQQVIRRSGVIPDSYNGKVLRQVINVFPKEELFQSSVPELHKNTLAVTRVYEQNLVRIIMRPDHLGRFINCILYVPRDIFNTTFRVQVQELIADAVGANEHEYAIFLSESTHARIYIIFRIDPDNPKTYNVQQLEAKIADIARSWQDHLLSSLIDTWGEEKGGELYRRYHNAFPLSYQENFDARLAVNDINTMAELESDDDIAMNFYQPIGFEASTMRFKVFRLSHRLELSDVVPVLEHLGLRVRGAHPYKICRCPATTIWLLDFDLKFGLPVTIDVQAARAYFQEAFAAIWREQADSDAFNRLVLGARLNWREVAVLRAYCAYMKQTRFNFSQTYIANTLSNHLEITRNLVAIFKIRFDPRFGGENSDYKKRIKRLKDKIIEGLDKVDNLNEDHIIRRYLALISHTMRTNFFQTDSDGDAKPVFALKLHPKKIPDIPQPHPEYEIFIYSPRVEGVHLRGGKVARGGIRWSKRLEDYRTEILGLVKAQQVKNAVIVPSGAKGGFIAKQTPVSSDRKALIEEGVACYQLFIQGLLDVTDNLVDGKVVAPPMVVRRDSDDPYLVVAADTGTATFSDIANDIAKRGDFWLGDAFASGGSQGYDHKKMGITARGAWVSVQRHFREYGINVQTANFTVIGIGDMAGDVFGNGMLMSEHICLVAAFNHQHIFVDPTPDAKTSFKERQRLFALTRSSWTEYNKDLLSKGGGIFSRDAKSIAISSEMRKVFHITAKRLTPEALLHALLKAPVDLIWNGGIGTYVKASHESQASAGDKANDTVRVNGNELHCRVFCRRR